MPNEPNVLGKTVDQDEIGTKLPDLSTCERHVDPGEKVVCMAPPIADLVRDLVLEQARVLEDQQPLRKNDVMVPAKIILAPYLGSLGTTACRDDMHTEFVTVVKLGQAEDITFWGAVGDRWNRAEAVASAGATQNDN